MKKFIFTAIIGLAIFSCEKEPVNKPAEENYYVPGAVWVEFTENTRLKSAFELVNNFHLEIKYVHGCLYFSKLPADSIDYIVARLNTKRYLNNGSWQVQKGVDVYINPQNGKITVVCIMYGMNEPKQTDWAITAAVLGLAEQPSPKRFYLTVPEGQEIYWRDKLRREDIVWQSDLIGLFYDN
jgi:hypothetical protein